MSKLMTPVITKISIMLVSMIIAMLVVAVEGNCRQLRDSVIGGWTNITAITVWIVDGVVVISEHRIIW